MPKTLGRAGGPFSLASSSIVLICATIISSTTFPLFALSTFPQQVYPSNANHPAPNGPSTSIRLVIEDSLFAELNGHIPPEYQITLKSKLDGASLVEELAAGNSLVWIANGSDIPRDLWIGSFRPAASALSISFSQEAPLASTPIQFRKSQVSSAYILPTKLMPFHNIDEEPRADFIPILEARDRFDQVIGYPGVLMHHYGPSTVRHRFAGSECYFFLFDHPSEALNSAGWTQLLNLLATRFLAHLQLKSVATDYSSYHLGERVLIRTRAMNLRQKAAATIIHFYVKEPGENKFYEIDKKRSCPDGLSDSEVSTDFLPHGRPGIWIIRAEAWQDPVHAEELAVEGKPVLVDRRDIGVVVLSGELHTPSIVNLNGPTIEVDRKDDFLTGTNYYPSTSWWDWLWRDFHPLKAAEDFTAMRRVGYRVVRMWSDPLLDEQSLRSMDAAIYLASEHGIVLDITIFTDWPRTISFERANGERVAFDFRGLRDFNVYGVSFHNLDLQKELVQVLAKRWKDVGNVIYDLSNEVYIRDPDPSQMDQEAIRWDGIPQNNGIVRNTLLFRRWAKAMTEAIRQAGGKQPIIAGDLFSEWGLDQYLGQRDGNIESVHGYSLERTGLELAYSDPVCSDRPMLLEEFGAWDRWNDEELYDALVHDALGGGAAGAMSYEWGISWFSAQLPFFATPLREARDVEPDPRWIPWPDLLVDRESFAFPRRSVGLLTAPSGFNWGSIYHGTPFAASSAIALGRLGRIGQGLGRVRHPEKIYVLVPTAFGGNGDGVDEVIETIHALRQQKAIFGIMQEDCLATVDKSTQVIIAPKRVSDASMQQLDALRTSGVQVFLGLTADWHNAVQVSQLSITPPLGSELLTRRTVEGTLYLVKRSGEPRAINLTTEHNTNLRLGLNKYVMVHERASGINLIEASGEVFINGIRFCTVEGGRVIVASADELDLEHTRHLRIVATEPTRIHLAHPIISIKVMQEAVLEPVGNVTPDENDKSTISIDSELVRYELRVDMR
jgi:hypothetical protein